MRSGAMPAALMATNSPLARGLAAWIMRATVSLPEPAEPVISTRLLAGATLAIICRNCWAARDRPIRPSGVRAWVRRRRFSRRRLADSMARSTISNSRSDLNGFSRNS